MKYTIQREHLKGMMFLTHSGGWSSEYPDAQIFTSERQAMKRRNEIAKRDKNEIFATSVYDEDGHRIDPDYIPAPRSFNLTKEESQVVLEALMDRAEKFKPNTPERDEAQRLHWELRQLFR